MTKLKKFFIGLSALIILSFFGYKYWQTQPSYSLLQIQDSIELKNPELFYKHVNVEKILAQFYEDLYELFEEYFSDIFDTSETSELFNAELMAENSFSYIQPEIESAIEKGLDNIWNESNDNTNNATSEFYSEEDIERAYDMLATSELAYIDKRGDKAYLGISMYDANSGEDLITEFELTKVNNYWQVTSWSNFKELIKEVIDDVIESGGDFTKPIDMGKGKTLTWKPYSPSVNFTGKDDPDSVDFAAVTHAGNWEAGYLARWIYSDKDRTCMIQPKTRMFAGYMFLNIWVNGKTVYEGRLRKAPTTTIQLQKGWNALVCRSSHHNWQWQLSLPITGQDGDDLSDLRYSIVSKTNE